MKSFFRNLVLSYKNDPIAFISVLTFIFAFFLIPLLRYSKPSHLSSIIIVISTMALIALINYTFYKMAKKHAFRIPDEPDSQCDFYLLLTDKGEVYPLSKKAIWSTGKNIKIVESDNYQEGKWRIEKNTARKKCYILTTSLKNILGKELNNSIKISIEVEKNFDPIEIYSIYKDNNLEIFDESIYINKALLTAIIERNKNNSKLENVEKLNLNEYLIDFIKENLIIPNFKNIKSYEIHLT